MSPSPSRIPVPTTPASSKPRLHSPALRRIHRTFPSLQDVQQSPLPTSNESPTPSLDATKRDSMSPLQCTTTLPNLKLTSPTPVSSPIHPYVGNVHITPACMAKSLSHRLGCGHLIVTMTPELCAGNCAPANDVQSGFVVGTRDLDGWYACCVCAEMESAGRKPMQGNIKGEADEKMRKEGMGCGVDGKGCAKEGLVKMRFLPDRQGRRTEGAAEVRLLDEGRLMRLSQRK